MLEHLKDKHICLALKRCYGWLCANIGGLYPIPQWIKDGKMSSNASA